MALLAEKPMHIRKLSRVMGEERRLVSFHLDTLEEHGFVTSKYEISEQLRSRGKALRVYTLSDKVAGVKAELKRRL